MRRCVAVALAVLALVAVVASVSVEARAISSPTSKLAHAAQAAMPHPDEVADEATKALWALRFEQMKARDFKRPTHAQLLELGFNVTSPNDGAYGVDQSSLISQSSFSCMRSKGYSFGVSRIFEEVCRVDSAGPQTVANAWAAGFAHMDVYLFPSYGCGVSAAGQVDAAINAMGNVPFGTLWFDIETGGNINPTVNHNWLQAAIGRAVQRIGGNRIGIYASKYEWGQVMGNYADVYSFPLWYPSYDGVPNFNNFVPFAGWTHPAIKQFAGSSAMWVLNGLTGIPFSNDRGFHEFDDHCNAARNCRSCMERQH